MTAKEKLTRPGQKKLLALDGGGIRGALTIEVLASIETKLRAKLGKPELCLADYFDFIGGTSTGAIIAAALSQGMSTAKLREFYEESGPAMFQKAHLLKRFRHKFADEALAKMLQQVFGADTTLGSERLKTLLLMVMRNATTDSPWPLSNNPEAMFNRLDDANCNLNFLLWKLIRASTAAPTYFPPEVLEIGGKEHLFVDGGVTPYNNPAFLMFRMATAPSYAMNWSVGEDQMLIVSVGTGEAANANEDLAPNDMNLLYHASSVPSALMAAASVDQDILCRTFGKCLVGPHLDLELQDMIDAPAPGGSNLFTYMRYNADLTEAGLKALGLTGVRPQDVQKLDSIEAISELQEIGRAVGSRDVSMDHFEDFL